MLRGEQLSYLGRGARDDEGVRQRRRDSRGHITRRERRESSSFPDKLRSSYEQKQKLRGGERSGGGGERNWVVRPDSSLAPPSAVAMSSAHSIPTLFLFLQPALSIIKKFQPPASPSPLHARSRDAAAVLAPAVIITLRPAVIALGCFYCYLIGAPARN